MSDLFYCVKCGIYTLKKKCGICGGKTNIRKPPRFSPQDNYGAYRRKLKKLQKD